ncbi:methionine--tRNA ligase [Bacteroidales bacterium OttesenSCG-928-K03]|nr:methionine--tRNA ligase [Odoribacter sp. OttesenSCG-928-L07]MDL2239447.1 methionine--tRNA ligase [Bacteroidales bacterium OttesenSCG-928-L14]MDL2240568.1 methionine--tRNA ligase [Bacteroidales bacterium OttesenSCG-928-K22]MDL2242650.1 methionine--tRNA ligase [Bacteroidales bacterium OttesenSCG-928-K03]
MNNFKRYTVTTALPYANGPLHIGHLAGVYIPADIYVRYLRSIGTDVVFIGGSDEHGVPITIKARKEGVTPQDIVDRYHNIIKKSFAEFGISFDVYSRTSNEIHKETASEFFLKLYNDGKLIEDTEEQYYDEEAKQFLADRYITGTCPICGNPKAYGDQCESCGTSLNARDLIEPKSTISGSAPILRETKHWYLPLDRYEDWLKEWILNEHKEWKVNVYGQCKSWLDAGLHPRAVTRDLDWGVKVPLKDANGKVLYVWFDAPIGYISATKELTNDWEKYWKDKDTRLIHFIGKDNIVFHCIIFPTMLKAEGSYILPDNVPAFEFLNLEGDKISTSRNWAVWLHEYLVDFPDKQDVLRYVLTANAPETKDNDFTWKDFQTKNNSELVAIFGNFINRTLVLTQKYFDGFVPPRNKFEEIDISTLEELKCIPTRIENSLDNFKFRESLSEMMSLARLGNKYLTETEPWKTFKDNPERVQTVLNIALQICANLAVVSAPFLPFTSEKIFRMLNLPSMKWFKAGNTDLLEPEHKLGEPVLLFEKIEDKDIEYQINRLEQIKTANDKESEEIKVSPQKETICFDDFVKIDIRTGKILEAEKVPKANKLLKLKIDTGIDIRTVVSGIAEFYNPEEIIGQNVSILVNLAPRNLRGIESEGMILMAENSEGKLCFVSPIEDFNPGSEIK